MNGLVLETKRFAVHDGPGVRTTIFLKGCPLKCAWCHNPESISHKKELGYFANKCVNCGNCISICPNQAHFAPDGRHVYDRSKCVQCGKCIERCYVEALKFYGRELSVQQAVELILEDESFYENSGGGVTFSGGEPLLQSDFCREVLTLLKKENIHCAIDTCGQVAWENFEKVIPFTDIFLYDLKHVDSQLHREMIGAPCELILENLRKLSKIGIPIEIRIPIVPGFNSDSKTIEQFGNFLGDLDNISAVKLLGYHNFSKNKYEALDLKTQLDIEEPSDQKLREIEMRLKSFLSDSSRNTLVLNN